MNYITVVRAKLKGSPQEAQMAHDATVETLSAMTRPMGAIRHRPHLNPRDPKEFLAIDTWNNLEGLQKFMSDPQVAAAFGQLFEGSPGLWPGELLTWTSIDYLFPRDVTLPEPSPL
jgi:quinol monooxygenase YgiN